MTLIKIKKELSMSFSLLQIKDDGIPEKKIYEYITQNGAYFPECLITPNIKDNHGQKKVILLIINSKTSLSRLGFFRLKP